MIINSRLHFKLPLLALVNVRTVSFSLRSYVPCPNWSFLLVFVQRRPSNQLRCKIVQPYTQLPQQPIGSFFLFLLKITKSIQSRFNLFTFRAFMCAALPPSPFSFAENLLAAVQKNQECWQTSTATFDFWSAAFSARPHSSSLIWVRDRHEIRGTTRA